MWHHTDSHSSWKEDKRLTDSHCNHMSSYTQHVLRPSNDVYHYFHQTPSAPAETPPPPVGGMCFCRCSICIYICIIELPTTQFQPCSRSGLRDLHYVGHDTTSAGAPLKRAPGRKSKDVSLKKKKKSNFWGWCSGCRTQREADKWVRLWSRWYVHRHGSSVTPSWAGGSQCPCR